MRATGGMAGRAQDQFNGQEIAMLMWAYAKLGEHPDATLFTQLNGVVAEILSVMLCSTCAPVRSVKSLSIIIPALLIKTSISMDCCVTDLQSFVIPKCAYLMLDALCLELFREVSSFFFIHKFFLCV